LTQHRTMVLLLIVCMSGIMLPAEAAELKIGVINPQKVLDGTKQGKTIKDMLADFVQTRQRLIESEETDLKKLESDLKQATVLNPAAKDEKERAFQQKMATYQRRLQQLEGEVQAKKREVLGEFTKTIELIVQDLAVREKIVLVLEKGQGTAGTPILFSRDYLDLTARVIEELNGKGAN
jgi:outer membrane protein